VIGMLAIGSALIGAAILAADSEPKAARIWTPDGEGDCMRCGLRRGGHSVVTASCPHTADSLTDQQVIDLWSSLDRGQLRGRGITLTDVLDASPEARARANAAGLYYPPPDEIDTQVAREKIAAHLNTKEPT
jgi:hypothetical protein